MPIIGGTDKMSAARVVGGSSRTYVKVDQWTHESFMAGLQKGETFVTNGPLLSFSVDDQLKASSWIAVRARHVMPNPDNWHRGITAAHSSPIYVTINDKKPAVLESATYLVARLDETIRWAQQDAHWSSNASMQRAINSFKAAREVYLRARDRAGAGEPD